MTTMAETPTRATWAWERHAPLAGVVAVACWVIGLILLEDATSGNTPAKILAQYNTKEGRILGGGVIWLIGTALFLWFLGSLRSRLLAAEGPEGRLTALAYGGGVAATVCIMLFPGADIAATIADDKDLDPSSAMALNTLSDAFFVAAEYLVPVLLAATALVALRRRTVLPRWLAWVTLFVALVMLVAPIGWAALIFAFPIWVLIVSYLLWTGTGTTAAGTPATTRPMS